MNNSTLLFIISVLLFVLAFVYSNRRKEELKLKAFQGEPTKYLTTIVTYIILGIIVLLCAILAV